MRTEPPTPQPAGQPASTDSPGVRLAVLLIVATGLLVVLVAGVTAVSGPADARFPIDNFTDVDETATVTPSGANVGVSGWVKCTEGETVEVRATVIQESTVATGRTRVRCLGETTVQSWTVHAAVRGPATFDADRSVRVEAWAATSFRGTRTDGPHTWANDEVTLRRR